jgi:hypothetical protein
MPEETEIVPGNRVLLTNGVSYPYRVISVYPTKGILTVRLSGTPEAPWRVITRADVASIEKEDGWHRA